jgi:hypothetical protein
MSLTQINNGDSGLDARGKINDAFAEVDTLSAVSWTTTGTGMTSDDTVTNIWSWEINTPGTQLGYNAMVVRATVVGYYPGSGGKAYGAELFGVFHTQAEGVTTQAGTTDVIEKSGFSTATSHLYVGIGGTIDFSVTGETGKNIWWNAEFRVMTTDYID